MIKRFFDRRSRRNTAAQAARVRPVAGAASRRRDAPDAGKAILPDDRLAGELLARLLLELPEHRRVLLAAFERNELERLMDCTHKLLGAVVYCDLPQLSAALRTLRQACDDGERERIRPAFHSAIRALDDVPAGCGQ